MKDFDPEFLREVRKGLSQPQKTLSPKWLYDERGSALFEEITDAPEYYPTRTEISIFGTAFPAAAQRVGPDAAIAEYGSGSSKKTGPLLQHLSPSVYVPLDISAEFLEGAAQSIQARFPDIEVIPTVADFTQEITLPPAFFAHHARIGFFPGSTIGNLETADATRFLARAKASLGEGAYFLLGADLIKDTAVLEAAYDDAAGITAAFNLNLLTRMNRELGANFDVNRFAHRAVWNAEDERIEMHLVSLEDQTVAIAGDAYSFIEGETIHTESSHKFTVDSLETIVASAGWTLEETWTDEQDWFGVFLLRA